MRITQMLAFCVFNSLAGSVAAGPSRLRSRSRRHGPQQSSLRNARKRQTTPLGCSSSSPQRPARRRSEYRCIKILHLTGPQAGTVDATPFLEIDGISPQRKTRVYSGWRSIRIMWRTATSTRATPLATTKARRTVRYQVSPDNLNIADPDKAHQRFIRTSNPTTTIAATGSALARLTPRRANTYQTTGDGGQNLDPGDRAQDLASNMEGVACRCRRRRRGRRLSAMRRLTTPSPSTTCSSTRPVPIRPSGHSGPQSMAGQFRPGNWRSLHRERRAPMPTRKSSFYRSTAAGGVNFGWSRKEGTALAPTPTRRSPVTRTRSIRSFTMATFIPAPTSPSPVDMSIAARLRSCRATISSATL